MEIHIQNMQFLEELLTSEYGIDLTYGDHMSHPIPKNQKVFSAYLSYDWHLSGTVIRWSSIEHRHDLEHHCWVDCMKKEEYMLIHKRSEDRTVLFFTNKYNEVIKYIKMILKDDRFDFDLDYPIQLFDFVNLEQLAKIDLYPIKFIRNLTKNTDKSKKTRIEHQAKILESRLWDMIIAELNFA